MEVGNNRSLAMVALVVKAWMRSPIAFVRDTRSRTEQEFSTKKAGRQQLCKEDSLEKTSCEGFLHH